MKGLWGMAMALAGAAIVSTASAQAPDAYWVYVKDKDGIVSMYPAGGGAWSTTDQFEELISRKIDASAAPSTINGRGTVCAGPDCPDAAVMGRLRNVPDFPVGVLVVRGTAEHAVFLERQ